MPTRRIATPAELTSWHAKVHTYGSFVKVQNPTWDSPDALIAHANELFAVGDAKTLKAQSKETDVWVRETLTPHQQMEVVRLMIESGVSKEHLPRTASRTKLTRLIGRGEVKSEVELSLARSALDAPEQYQLSPEELAKLGNMVDRHSTKLTSEPQPGAEA